MVPLPPSPPSLPRLPSSVHPYQRLYRLSFPSLSLPSVCPPACADLSVSRPRHPFCHTLCQWFPACPLSPFVAHSTPGNPAPRLSTSLRTLSPSLPSAPHVPSLLLLPSCLSRQLLPSSVHASSRSHAPACPSDDLPHALRQAWASRFPRQKSLLHCCSLCSFLFSLLFPVRCPVPASCLPSSLLVPLPPSPPSLPRLPSSVHPYQRLYRLSFPSLSLPSVCPPACADLSVSRPRHPFCHTLCQWFPACPLSPFVAHSTPGNPAPRLSTSPRTLSLSLPSALRAPSLLLLLSCLLPQLLPPSVHASSRSHAPACPSDGLPHALRQAWASRFPRQKSLLHCCSLCSFLFSLLFPVRCPVPASCLPSSLLVPLPPSPPSLPRLPSSVHPYQRLYRLSFPSLSLPSVCPPACADLSVSRPRHPFCHTLCQWFPACPLSPFVAHSTPGNPAPRLSTSLRTLSPSLPSAPHVPSLLLLPSCLSRQLLPSSVHASLRFHAPASLSGNPLPALYPALASIQYALISCFYHPHHFVHLHSF